MSDPDFREPTNEQLWSQPPADTKPDPGDQSLVAAQPAAPHGNAVARHGAAAGAQPRAGQRPDRTVFVLAIVSLALGVPLSAIASSTAGLLGLLIVWVGIVAVNFTYAHSRRQ